MFSKNKRFYLVFAVIFLLTSRHLAFAEEKTVDQLLLELKGADETTAPRYEREIWRLWSKSGSPSMDILLERGRQALTQGNYPTAINHFSALIDHAPDFAEGYNARATAYYEIGKYGLSMADIAKTLSLNPNHFGALAGMGMIFEELGDLENAEKAYRASQAIHPFQPGVNQAIERIEGETKGDSA